MTTPESDFESVILAELNRQGYQPRRSKELARDLKIPKADYRSFRDTLKAMERAGRVQRQRGGRWSTPEPDPEVIGVVHIARAGYGFLVPEDTSLDDVFLPEENLGSALDGDRVKVTVERHHRRDYRHFGRVIEVLERGRPRIVALVTGEGKARPEDPKNPFDYAMEAGGAEVRAGLKVLLEITRWPGEGGDPAGKVLEVLGPAGEPDTETAAILASFDAPGPFPDPVKQEVRNLKRKLTEEEQAQRLDLTELVTFTIDPETARDFDDALSFERKPDGKLVVGVHIADVSHFVKPGSRLDEEARDRSTSIYLPGRVIPMLPEELSNDLCSLRPDEDHLTKTVFLHYDAEGNRLNYTIHRSIIHSHRRFTYKEVKTLLEGQGSGAGDQEPGEDPAVMDALQGLYGLAQTLRQKRLEEGAIELNLPEFQVIMDEDGHATDIEEVEHDFSHQLVEDFMLVANVALAEWCTANGMPVLYRIHESPAEEELEDLAEFLTACGYPLKAPYRREHLNAIISKVHGKPEEHAVNLAILKSFKQAVYGPAHDIGHFALNFPHYMHFTSPIRRYPDLHLHQMLDSVFGDKAHKLPKKLRKLPQRSGKALIDLGTHTSQRERRAMKIEEAVKDFRHLELLSRQGERDFKAVVTGIRKFGVFVEIEGFLVEGMIPRWMLEKAGYSAREEIPGAKGKRARRRSLEKPGFHLGQEVQVRITGIDLAARMCEMEFLGIV